MPFIRVYRETADTKLPLFYGKPKTDGKGLFKILLPLFRTQPNRTNMKPCKIFILLAGLCVLAPRAAAQFSISKVTPKEADIKNKKDTVKEISAVTKNPFFSESRYRAERRKLRKERNTLNCTVGLNLNQTGFDNWVGGGNNTFDATASLLFSHVYSRDKFNTTYSLDSKYGMNVISGKTFKNIDYFIFNVNSGWAISKNWSYSASANLRSQWTKGYRSADDKTMISNFMSPGTLTVGVGLTYKAFNKDQNRNPFIMTINPISGNMQFVLSDTLSKQGLYGVPAGRLDHQFLLQCFPEKRSNQSDFPQCPLDRLPDLPN